MANVLKILIIDNNPNDGETIINTIKSAGYAVRSQHIDSVETLDTALVSDEHIDIVLNDLDHKALSLMHIIEVSNKRDHPPDIIAISKSPRHAAEKSLALGATDHVAFDKPEHLKQVIKRTVLAQKKAAELAQIKSVYGELQERCSAVLSKFEQPIAYLHDGIHVYANPAYLNLFTRTSFKELEGIPIMDLLQETDQAVFKTFLREHIQDPNNPKTLEITLIVHNKPITASIECSNVFYDGESCQQIVIQPESDASLIAEQLNYLSIYDVSSGLYTHNHLIEQLEKVAAAQTTPDIPPQALMLLSLDNYNALASSLGMAETDLLYAQIGTNLKNELSLDDLLCRYDSATFGLLTRNIQRSELDALIQHLLSSVNDELFEINGKSVPAHLSAGITILSGHITVAYNMISQAFKALQSANRNGEEFRISNANSHGKSQKTIDDEWVEKLRASLKKDLFRLFYQPIIRVPSDHRERYTVSIRILNEEATDKEDRFISPSAFLPSAERSGYANGIDRWVIMNTLETLIRQQHDGHSPTLFIKLTGGTLYHEDDISWIRKQIVGHEIDPNHLAFEINTSSLTNHLQQTRRLIEDIKPLGCRIVIDDFGSSLNPFQILKHVDIDFLKLDKSLTADITHNTTHQQLVERITQDAHKLGKEVIAQKVEEANQFFILKELNVDYLQGYFLQQPGEALNYDFSVLT
jgi:diguanylate cyclase (GGDEF)-like protein